MKKITIHNLAKSSKQEVFDFVANHLLTQNQTSIIAKTGEKVCAYRGAEGRKCAAGVLIPDEDYSPNCEKNSWLTLVIQKDWSKRHRNLITGLQVIHDNYIPAQWKQQLLKSAQENKLDSKIIETF